MPTTRRAARPSRSSPATLLRSVQVLVEGGFRPADVLLTGGRVSRVASPGERCGRNVPALTVVEVAGAFLLPSFTDAHLHLACLAREREGVDLRGVRESAPALDLLRARAETLGPGGWLVAWNWNPNLWLGAEPLGRKLLERAFPGRPVVVKSADLHSLLVNGAALAAAGLHDSSVAPPGGSFGRDAAGRLDGRLFDLAGAPVLDSLPKTSGKALAALVLEAAAALHRAGVTAVLDFDGAETLPALQALSGEGRLPLRVMSAVHPEALPDGGLGRLAPLQRHWDGSRLASGPLKLFVDGSLGSQTALMEADYEGAPGARGLQLLEPDRLAELVRAADAADRTVAVHAIGDRANRAVLEAFEHLGSGRCRALRHRVEHAQLLAPGLSERMARTGVTASVQPIHLAMDIAPGRRHWGERCRWLYALRDLHAAGVPLAFGSDAPVAPPSPLEGVRCAVQRSNPPDEPGAFHGEQRLSVLEALEAATLGSARALFGEGRWGRVVEGCFADLVLLDGDPRAMESGAKPPEVLATYLEGERVYKSHS